jgi:multicomponent Na+:H+ antiporter subunit E
MSQIIMTLLLWLVYLGLTSDFGLPNLILGLLVALACVFLLRQRFHLPHWTHLARKPFDILVYFFYLGVDMIRSGVQVARIVFDPKLPIDPGIVAVCTYFSGEFGMALTAHAMTITPGEIVMEFAPDGTLFVHSLQLDQSPQPEDQDWGKRWKALQRVLE